MTVITTNVSALRAQNASRAADMQTSQAMARLSSGKRINSAKDDAAGLAVATRMGAQIRGFNQAIRNANDGISLAQTAEGAMAETSNILVRMRELAVQAASGTIGDADRAALQVEVAQLIAQVDDIANRTKYNGTALLDGTAAVDVQVGINDTEIVNVTVASMLAEDLGVDGVDLSDAADASAALATIDTAIDSVATERANLGAAQSRLDSTVNNLTNSVENLSASKSRIEDADYSVETTKLASAQILAQASTAMLAQANQSQQGVLQLLRG